MVTVYGIIRFQFLPERRTEVDLSCLKYFRTVDIISIQFSFHGVEERSEIKGHV